MGSLAYFFYFFLRYNLQIFIGSLIGMLSLKKRKHFTLRVLLSFLVYTAVSFLLIFFNVHCVLGIISFDFLLYFLMVLVVEMFCFDVSVKECLFYGMASYTVQNLVDSVASIAYTLFGFSGNMTFAYTSLVVSLVVYPLFYFLLKWKIGKSGSVDITIPVLSFTAAFTILIVFLLPMLTRIYAESVDVYHYLYGLVACVLLLFLQFGLFQQGKLYKEKEVTEHLISKDETYQKYSEENINLINIKCHDLKKQITHLKEMEENKEKQELISDIEKQVKFYDSNLKTGCKTLDVLLMEKSLLCQKHQIQLSCIIDGKKLSFMSSTDIYTLFANAIDNAIESLVKVEDKDKRVITINVSEKVGFVFIHMENEFVGQIHFENGLPLTMKGDSSWHGYGMKSIQYIVNKYNGTMSIHTDGNVFQLNISFALVK